jgi:hypothetical protein
MTEAEDRAKEREVITAALHKADIGRLYWNKALPQYGDRGRELREYLKSGYAEDKRHGFGLYIHGKAKERHLVLPTLAKELVLLKDNVQYVSLRKLIHVVNSGGEDLEWVMRVDALCVGQFYDDSIDKPYSGYDLSNVEDVLRTRIENLQRNYLSATSITRDAVWYSEEFRELIAESTREYHFGIG